MKTFYLKHFVLSCPRLFIAAPALAALFVALLPAKTFAQAPTISYSSPQTYAQGVTIPQLVPTSRNVGDNAYAVSVAAIGSGFSAPTGVAIDAAGNVYVADYGNSLVKKIPVGGGSPVIVGSGFSAPIAVALDRAGNLYVADYGKHAIFEVPAGGGAPRKLSSNFNQPTGVAVDGSGNVFVADQGNNAVYELPEGSTAQWTLGSGFSHPTGVAVDGAGNVYIADSGNKALKEIPIGNSVPYIVFDTNSPLYGVAVDAIGDIFVSEGGTGFGAIEEYLQSGNLAGYGAGLSNPGGLTIDGTGKTYVADQGNNVVKEMTPGGGYFLNKALPPGLYFDNNTGIISRTPTSVSPPTNYTVTTYNSAGVSASAMINIAVASNNTNLSDLKISSGPLTPVFAAGTTAYTAAVGNGTAAITVTPTTGDPGATVSVNNTAVTSGTASGAIPLNVGSNTINTTVTAPGGATQTYTITVTRAPSGVAALAGLSIPGVTLSPAFATATTAYTAAVSNNVTSVTVKPSAAGVGAIITVNETPVTSGTLSQSILLTVGANTISIVVTAQDGVTTNTYTATVTRAPSNVAALAGLGISSGALSPAFTPSATGYSVSEATTVTAVTVKPTAAGIGAVITVNGTPATSGTNSQSIPLVTGPNTITVVVTAQDGVTQKTYTLTVTQALSNVATLSMLAISNSALNPAFSANNTSYTATDANTVSAVAVKPVAKSNEAAITVNGTAVASGVLSQSIPLTVGPNVITVVVTAEDGVTKQTYTVTINREASGVAALAGLSVTGATLSPTFATQTTSYTVAEDNSVASVTLKPTAVAAGSSITVNSTAVASGSLSAAVPLAVGPNPINVVVTAPDGITTNTYTVTVTRAPSSVAALAGLGISSGALSPTFATHTTTYTAAEDNSVASVTLKPTAAGVGASIMVNGAAVTSGTPSPGISLAVGDNPVSVVVTAQDGVTTTTYTVTITRAAAGVDGYDPGVSVVSPTETPVLAGDGIIIHQAVTPNGDGINDFLQIDNINQYPDNKLSIMNRNGQLIYEASAYDNSSKVFDGHSSKNGQLQLPGTYFYQLDYIVNGITKHKTGFIVLKY